MLFLLYFSVLQFKKAFDEPQPTPETYPVAVSTRQMTIENNYQCEPDDPDCPYDDLSSPSVINCGQRCWSTQGDAIFNYKFKGEQFVIYGKKASNHGSFDIYINETLCAEVNEKSDTEDTYALLFTSGYLPYGEHSIKMQGKGSPFELFRFSYWPSLKARRYNVTQFTSSSTWTEESDENGGIRQYTNNINARKSISVEGSKVWVFASKAWDHGIMNVKFNVIDEDIDTQVKEVKDRVDGALVFESKEVPFGFYNLDITCKTNIILVYCVYVLFDPPEQTKAPHPSRTYYPETDQTYINKVFRNEEIPNSQIQVWSNSKINQISGCKFIDIQETTNYFTRIEKEIPYFDNRVEYSTVANTRPAPLWVNYAGKFTIQQCTFIKSRGRINEGNVLTSQVGLNVIFEGCTFLNCGDDQNQVLVGLYHPSSSAKFYDCSFSFDIEIYACPALRIPSSNVVFERCTFSKCPAVSVEPKGKGTNGDGTFQFIDNLVTQANQRAINVNIFVHTKPVITGNIFQKNSLTSYLFVIQHTVDEIELFNNTFSDNILSGNLTVFGGSNAIWIQRENVLKSDIVFDQCKFINNQNNHEVEDYSNGGAFQCGYSKNIANVSLKFQHCEFKNNKCTNGKGGALSLSVNHDVSITDCIFEDNTASGEGGAIYIWGKIVEPSDYQQDVAEALQMNSITITNTQFKSNKALNGNAIYIEQEHIEKVKLEITKSTFENNGDSSSSSMIVSFCGEVIFEDNEVKYTDKTKTCSALYLDVPRSLTLLRSNFTNCITTIDSSITLTNQDDNSLTTIKSCIFIDCKAGLNTIIISGGLAEVEDCSVSFENNNANSACCSIKFLSKGISCKYSKFTRSYSTGSITYDQPNGKSDSIIVSDCIFDDCAGTNSRCFFIKVRTADITFTNNLVRNMKATGNSGYFGVFATYVTGTNFEFKNFTLQDNTCNSEYGGGSGLWVQYFDSITFDTCKFINNVALKSTNKRARSPAGMNYFAADGGAIQYGHSGLIYNVDMLFKNCTFSQNKAVRHGGAIAIQTCKKVEIIQCIFDGNEANYKPSSLLETTFQDYYNLKDEGRGGAIYINPVFTYDGYNHNPNDFFLREITIEKCTFTSNSAFDGYAIYIEGDDPGTKFVIKDNKFNGNYDFVSNSKDRGTITSEIENLYEGKIVSSNTFDQVLPLVYVDHRGRTPDPTPMATPTQSPSPMATPKKDELTEEDCEKRCYYVEQDKTSQIGKVIEVIKKEFDENSKNESDSGGAIYFIDCGLLIKETTFTGCQSTVGGGGAIYLNNNLELRNQIKIEDAIFKNCKSLYGGAVYIRSRSYNDEVLIYNSTFTSNILLPGSDQNSNLFGGSALYLHSRNGIVELCQFSLNKGKGGAVRIINHFDDDNNRLSLMQNIFNPKMNHILINDCLFFDQDKSTSSIYYVAGSHGSEMDVTNCEFKGILDKGNHYIDGKKVHKDGKLIHINSCKFDSDSDSSLNLKEDFILANLKNQVFDSGSIKQKSNNNLLCNYACILGVGTLVVVVVIIIVIKMTKENDQEISDNDDDNSQNP